jgi:polyhydroxyalkanoate synthesis regulator protein
MFRFLLYFFLIYLGYQFIFNFLIPIFKTTQQVRKNVRAMHDRMNEFADTQQNSASPQSNSRDESSKEPIGDYIDFEEVK